MQLCDYGSSTIVRILRYLDLSWSQTHDQRLASYEISAALAGLQAANTAAEQEAEAEREASSMPAEMMRTEKSVFMGHRSPKKRLRPLPGKVMVMLKPYAAQTASCLVRRSEPSRWISLSG